MKKKKATDKIYLKLNKISDAYSDYSTEEHITIKEEFHEHIMNLADDKSVKNDVEINIHLNTPASIDEKATLVSAIKSYNKYKVRDITNTIKLYFMIAGLLLLAGVGLSLIYFFAPITNIIVEFFLEIGTWVFIWELVDIVSFQIPSIKFKAYLNTRIIKSKIKFIENDSDKETK